MRLFLALYFPETVLAPLRTVCRRLDGRFSHLLRATDPGQLHMTLSFLGEVSETELPAINAALAAVAARHTPFRMDLTAIGRFPDRGAPRVLWAGLRSPDQQCEALQRSLETAMLPFAPVDTGKPFTPHITVARIRRGTRASACAPIEQFLRSCGSVEGGCTVESFALVSSHLLPQGARHEVVQWFGLGSSIGSE